MTTETLEAGAPSAALSASAAANESYLNDIALGLVVKLSDADLLAEIQELEFQTRSMLTASHALLAQVEQRGLARRVAATSTSALLQAMLQLSPYEAKQRVDAATELGPRLSLDGQALPPLLPEVAAAQTRGLLSAEHARVIGQVIDRIPTTTGDEDFRKAETQLVKAAQHLRPREVGHVGKRLLAYLDPDGVLGSDEEHERRRTFSLVPLSDGSYRAQGYLTPQCGAQLMTALSPLSAPAPAAEDAPDGRTFGQRLHDGLDQLAGLALRCKGILNDAGTTQLVITMTADQLASGTGYAETSFGQLLSVEAALKLADEAQIACVIQDAKGAVLAQGRTRRVATRAQTLALIARDRGCSFPGCDRPPEWCQRHHVIRWIDGGPTDVDNLTLVCSNHHRNFEKSGWRCVMRDGLPWWIPPAWLDRQQEPRLNQRIRHG